MELKSVIIMLTAVCMASSCEGLGGPDLPDQPSDELRTVSLHACSENPASKTSLAGTSVLWDEDDCIRVMGEGGQSVLTGTLTQKSSGLGVKVNISSQTAQVRYSDISVTLNGKDVTASYLKINDDYKIGIYNSDGKYQYVAPGEIMMAEVNGKETIPIIQSSSSSSVMDGKNKVVVTITGFEYCLDGVNWVKLGPDSKLVNGFSNKKEVEYVFDPGNALDWRMKLSSQPGLSFGDFTAQTTSGEQPDASTVAVFPADALASYSSGVMSINLPYSQSYADSSFDHAANVMTGVVSVSSDGYDVRFLNMCGVLQLSLTGDAILSEIRVTDRAGKPLWGRARLPFTSLEAGISVDMLSGGSSSISLDCTGVALSSEPKDFYLVLPVGAFASGFDVCVMTDDGRTQSFGTGKTANIIARADIKEMPVVAIDKLSEAPEQVLLLHNDALEAYMSYGRYTSFGATSYFGTYSSVLNQTLCVDKDYPMGLDVRWSGDKNASYSVTLTDVTKGRDVYTDRSVTGTETNFVNLIPGHSYAWTVKSDGAVTRSGRFRTTGQVRMVKIDDSWNWRDLGGWESSLGGTVRYEWLYRGGSLNGVWDKSVTATTNTVGVASNYVFSDSAAQQVRDLGILSELDLRGKTGDGQAWSQESGIHSRSIEVTHMPIASSDYKQLMTDQGLQNPLVDYAVVQDVAWIIDQVVGKNHPVAFHCKSGADRTGAVGMIILALLGVDPGDIARDYELTTLSHEKLILNGTSSFQTRRADGTTYDFFMKGFTTKTSITVEKPKNNGKGVDKVTYQLSGMQEQAYYYLNRHFDGSGVAISSTDLDAFINKMLGISDYAHPEWAASYDGRTLEQIYNK